MASNLSSIGFEFSSAEDFQETMLRLAPNCIERVGCEAGDYSIWRSRTGAEIWFHLPMLGTEDDARDIAGLTPYFEGLSEIEIEVVERFQRPEDNPFEGALTAQVRETGSGAQAYPLTFDAVDFSLHAARTLPFTAQARIAGFARHLHAFVDEQAHAAGDGAARSGIALAPQAFIPVGQFAQDAESDAPTEAASTALLTGRVEEHTRHTNEVTGRAFHWLLVESLAATFDILADPAVVVGDIVVGGTVEIGCVLIGRLIDAAPQS